LPVGTQTATPQADGHLPIHILFEKYTEKSGAILSFVKIDTGIGRFKRRSLHVTGRIERPAAYPPASSKSEEVFLVIQI